MLARFYQKNKEKLWEKAGKRYQNLSEEDKRKKWKYGRKRYKNLSEEEKNNTGKYHILLIRLSY